MVDKNIPRDEVPLNSSPKSGRGADTPGPNRDIRAALDGTADAGGATKQSKSAAGDKAATKPKGESKITRVLRGK